MVKNMERVYKNTVSSLQRALAVNSVSALYCRYFFRTSLMLSSLYGQLETHHILL